MNRPLQVSPAKAMAVALKAGREIYFFFFFFSSYTSHSITHAPLHCPPIQPTPPFTRCPWRRPRKKRTSTEAGIGADQQAQRQVKAKREEKAAGDSAADDKSGWRNELGLDAGT